MNKIYKILIGAAIALVLFLVIRRILRNRPAFGKSGETQDKEAVKRQNRILMNQIKKSGYKLTHTNDIYIQSAQGLKNAFSAIDKAGILDTKTKYSLRKAIIENMKYTCRNPADLLKLYDVFEVYEGRDLLQNLVEYILFPEPELFKDLQEYMNEISDGMEFFNFERY
jgi:hypothetical protein